MFSLSPTKVVVAGEGGLVATRDEELARTLRLGRDYGNPGDYDCRFAGLNARMSELHAATALHSLSLLDDALVRRHALVRLFWAELGEVPGVRGPRLDDGDVSTYKDLTVVLDEDVTGISARDPGPGAGRRGRRLPPLLRPADPPPAGVRPPAAPPARAHRAAGALGDLAGAVVAHER